MKKFYITIILFLFVNFLYGQNQGINNNWLMGYDSEWGFPFGISKLNFFGGAPVISLDSFAMEFNHTHSNISDAQGNLLFYTNGYYIADATDDTMQNGTGINPSSYTSYFSDGLGIPQANIILPMPGNGQLYYFIHSTANQYPGYTCSYNLYLSIIDMNLNSGLGAVTIKNQIILSDSMNYGKLTACKHANGRDWWVISHRINSNEFFKFLITPYSYYGPFNQNIGLIRFASAGEAWFGPDGTRYAHYGINTLGLGNLEIFDFDRCTGTLSNAVNISIAYENSTQVGMAFSPNSNVLYVCNVFHVYQFDLTSTNIAASQLTVAVYDSFVSGIPSYPSFPTLFCLSELAPDGKIYITTGNSTVHLHSIDNPDVLGIGCNVNQHSVQLPAYYFNTLPNHPNYFLGADSGSVCDSLTNIVIKKPPEIILSVFPNPSNGVFTLHFPVHKTAGELEIYDMLGELVRKENVAQWSQYKNIDISALPSGIYLCRMKFDDLNDAIKIVKE